MKSIRARISESGRLSLPAEFRKEVGLDRGGDVVVQLDGKVIHIRTVDQAIAEAQAWSRKVLGKQRGASVGDFIAERRREAKKEKAEDTAYDK